MIPESQQALFRAWAGNTDFIVDPEKSPKAEFARLAKAKGWVGGDAAWRAHWKVCFGEPYPVPLKISKGTGTQASSDIADSMRNLSIGSDPSSFSVISWASRVDSFGSVRSLNSEGFQGSVHSWNSNDSDNSVLSLDSVQSLDSIPGGVNIPTPEDFVDSDDESTVDGQCRHGANRLRTSQRAMSQWYDYPGFTPCPTASFKQEFARLAQHQRWKGQEEYKHFVEMLKLEIAHHFEDCVHVLKRHQDLCEDLGIEEIPTTLTQCKKSLKSVNVNLYHLIDHKRDPATKLKLYSSYSELARNLRKKGNRVPKGCAKADGFIKVLLKRAF